MHPILDSEAQTALTNFQMAVRKQRSTEDTLRVKLQSVGEETIETFKRYLSEEPLRSFFLVDKIEAIETNPNRNKFTVLIEGGNHEIEPAWRCMATVEIKGEVITLEVSEGLGSREQAGQSVTRNFADGGLVAELLTDGLLAKLIPGQVEVLKSITRRLDDVVIRTQAKIREIRSTKEIMLCNVLDNRKRSIATLQSVEPRRIEEWNELLEAANAAFADILNQDGYHWENRTAALEEAFKAGLPNFIAAFTNSKLQMLAVKPAVPHRMTDFQWESQRETH